jgi:hydrogenase maturation protease
METRHARFGVPPLGGAVPEPPKGGTPNPASNQALSVSPPSIPEFLAEDRESTALGSVTEPHGPRTLVLGLGNDILTDDAVGLWIARRLQEEFQGISVIEVRETCEMGLALLDHLAGFEQAFILDSIQTGRVDPGVLHELDPATLARLAGPTPHFVGVGEVLALGRQLGLEMPRRVRIFAVEVADPFSLGTSLSPSVQEAYPAIVDRIRNAVLIACAIPNPPTDRAFSISG